MLLGGDVGHGDDPVDHGAIEDVGDEAGTEPLDAVHPGRLSAEHGARGRLDGDDADAGSLALEHTADAGDRPAGADAGDERDQVVADRVEDLARRRHLVGVRVRRVGELPRP